jgi:hypothetical protein
MIKKNTQCSLAGLGRTMASWAQGRHRFDGVTGSRHRRLGEDDVVAGLVMAS